MPKRSSYELFTKLEHTRLAVCLSLFLGGSAGCSSFAYYSQAALGHLELMRKSRPIAEVLEDPTTDATTRARLMLALDVRKFASRELLLPDNESYTYYAALNRPHVIWNVFAAPALSLEPVQSCFLFVGCLSYRGYYQHAQALAYAQSLREAGLDVAIGGVSAYSTLGWFTDPILDTMFQWDDKRFVEVIFHELAHQLIFVKNDSRFNESFAVTVARHGYARWRERGNMALRIQSQLDDERENILIEMLLQHRQALAAVYASNRSEPEKMKEKSRIFATIQRDYQTLKTQWRGYTGFDEWMTVDMNNAKLSSVATYHADVPAFNAILAANDYDLENFYAHVKALATLAPAQRRTEMDKYLHNVR